MAGTVTPDLTDISLCESPFAGWTNVGTGTPGLNDPTVFDAIQGSYCYQDYRASLGNRGEQWDFGAGTPADFTNKAVIFWFAFSKKNFGANPMRIRMTDTSGNWSEWNMFTASALPHPAWLPWMLKPTVTRDAGSGTLVLSAIRYVDWRCDAVAAKVYIYWDAVRYGYGLSIKGGTDVAPAVIEDLVTADVANAYGIVSKFNDVYFYQGQLKIGSLVVDENTYFKDTNQLMVFKSIKGNPTGFYGITGQRAASGAGTTKIFFGTKSGTAGISGCVIKASTEKFGITMTDTNITEFGFYGCTFQNAATIQGQAYNVNKEFLSSNFITCTEVLPDTGIVNYCKFISSPLEGVRMINSSHHITNCDFIDCTYGLHCNFSTEVNISNLKFTGSNGTTKWDIKHSVAGVLTVHCQNGSNPQYVIETGGGSTTLDNPVVLTLTGLPNNTEVTVVKLSDMSVLYHVENSSGNVVYNYGAGEIGLVVDILAVHLDYDPHIGQILSYTLGSSNATIPISLVLDPTYSNP